MESGKIIVVANQKGGVAKTSTVRNLSYALAEMGKKVLVVDFDPQYNLTTSFGVLPTQAPYNTGTLITNLLLDESLPDTNEFIQKIGSVDLIPSSRSLTVAEANLLMTPDSNDYLAALLSPLRLSYDYIIVDTNPSLGSLTINALTAADEVIIPIDPELFALTGLQALVDTIKKIKRKLNPSIEIGGIIYDCGVMQTPTSIFRDADHRLLCGSVLPYEIPVFHKALSECGSLEVRPVAICVPQEIQEYCMELFGENVQIAAASHDLFAKRVNGQIYRPLVEKYIAGEKRL